MSSKSGSVPPSSAPLKRANSQQGSPSHSTSKPMSPVQVQACNEILSVVLQETDAKSRRLLGEQFRELPDRNHWPDYYAVISEPMCLNDLLTGLEQNQYRTAQDFYRDLQLVFLNAQYYNEPGSQIYVDATQLQHLITHTWSIAVNRGTLPAIQGPTVSATAASPPPHPAVRAAIKSPAAAGQSTPGAAPVKKVRGPYKVKSKEEKERNKFLAANPHLAGQLPPTIPSIRSVTTPQLQAKSNLHSQTNQSPQPTPQPQVLSVLQQTPQQQPPAGEGFNALLAAAAVNQSQQSQVAQSQPIDAGQNAAAQLLIQQALATQEPPAPAGGDEFMYSPAPGSYENDYNSPAPGEISAGPTSGYEISEDMIEEEDMSPDDVVKYNDGLEAVAELENSLPRLDGFESDVGFMKDQDWSWDAVERIFERLKALGRPMESLDALPETSEDLLLSYTTPLSLSMIEQKLVGRGYSGAEDLDQDMMRLFEKGRRFYLEGSREYGEILLIQRYYQHLTTPGSSTAGPRFSFSSTNAGPGRAKAARTADLPLVNTGETVTSFRIQTKDREFINSIDYKGANFTCGDYVHLINPDEAGRPIIAHIFKIFMPTVADPNTGKKEMSVAACYYYRPEQTVHPLRQRFYEREVFKTGHFVDHILEDIIEKVGCQFYTKSIRGRPKPPFWYPGYPLYVCDSRYNDKEQQMIKIKNWNSCIPEELRKTDFMPFDPFNHVIKLGRVKSPFLIGTTGGGVTGHVGMPKAGAAGLVTADRGDDDDDDEGGGRSTATPGRSGLNVGIAKKMFVKGQTVIVPSDGTPRPGLNRMVGASGSATPIGSGTFSRQPSQPPSSSTVWAQIPSVPAGPMMPKPGQIHSFGRPGPPQAPGGQSRPVAPVTKQPTILKLGADRSIAAAVGGKEKLRLTGITEELPADIVNKFDKVHKSLLWFSGPPTFIPAHRGLQPSLTYLMHRSAKRQKVEAKPSTEPALDPRLVAALDNAQKPLEKIAIWETLSAEFQNSEELNLLANGVNDFISNQDAMQIDGN